MTEALPELRDSMPEERLGRPPVNPVATPAPLEPAAPIAPVVPAIPKDALAAAQKELEEVARINKLRQAAAKTRWAGRVDWEVIETKEGLTLLAELRAECEKAALTMQRRISEEKVNEVQCYNPDCKKQIDVGRGHFAGSRTRFNSETGQLESAYACSAACYLIMCRLFTHRR